MFSFTKADLRMRCRACLIKVITDEEEEINIENDSKNAYFISIAGNSELESLINKYITDEKFREHSEKYPQILCLNCFDKLQQANKFLTEAQLNAKVLYELFSQAATEEKLQTEDLDINKLLLKDSLMESETVLLDTTSLTQPDDSEETNNHDPFNIELKTDNILYNSDDKTDDDDEWEADSNVSSFSDEISKRKPTTRSKAKKEVLLLETPETKVPKIEPNKVCNEANIIRRKKRRNKKEMEEYLREKHERMKRNNIKRRQKGTRNDFKCSQCGHRFGHKLNLDAHIRKVHEGQSRAYHCDQCNKTYCHSTGLFNHIKDVHEANGQTFACDVPNCNRIYKSFLAFQYHKRIGHLDEVSQRRYVCEQCGATFNLSSKLISHRKVKHPTEAEKLKKEQDGPYECDICKGLFKSSQTLKNHKRQIHSNEMKYECEICKQKFRQNSSLLYHHQLAHTTEKIPCLSCEKMFVRKYELQKHVRAVHMKIKPFQCKYCPESFASGKTRRHHEYIHTGEKPYVCDVCGKAYRQPTCLKNHRKTHEKNAL